MILREGFSRLRILADPEPTKKAPTRGAFPLVSPAGFLRSLNGRPAPVERALDSLSR